MESAASFRPRECLLDTSLSASPHPTSFYFYNREEQEEVYIYFNVFQYSGWAYALEDDKVVRLPQKMILTWGKHFRFFNSSKEGLTNGVEGHLPSLELAQGAEL